MLEEREGVSPIKIILKQLKSPLIYLLIGAGLVSLLPGHYIDAAVIAGGVQTTVSGLTPLQKRMSRLSTILGIAGLSFAGVVFGIGLLTGYELFEMALFSVAVAVSVIPGGLPAVISVTLALGVQRRGRAVSKISTGVIELMRSPSRVKPNTWPLL